MGGLLNDQALLVAIKTGAIGIEPRKKIDSEDYGSLDLDELGKFNKDGAVQPSSLDLRVGRIYAPAAIEKDGMGNATLEYRYDYTLKPGETVSVETLEKVTLGAKFSAIGFPIARVSSQAILMTNPGHIDPGYSGHLSFTLINMGKRSYRIKTEDPVVSLLFFELREPSQKDYAARRSETSNKKSYDDLATHLAPDFADFTRRMEEAADESVAKKVHRFESAVRDAKTQFNWGMAIFVAIGSVIGVVASYGVTAGGFVEKESYEQLEERVDSLEDRETVGSLEARIAAIEEASKNQSSILPSQPEPSDSTTP